MEFNLQSIIRPSIAALKAYRSARDEYNEDDDEMIFMDANENPYDNNLNRYPDPHQLALKQVIAKQKGCKSSQLLLGNGSDEILDLIIRAFCEPKVDSLITLPPTYGMYQVLADLNQVKNTKVLLTREFKPDVDAILAAVDENTKIIFLCSPNNPTGNSFSERKIERLLSAFNGLVIIDEAYIDFSSELSWMKRLDEFPNLVVTQTFSKAYGMAGIRLGMCFASEEIIEVLKKIKPPYNVNTLTQDRAMRRLRNMKKIKKEIDYIKANRTKLSESLMEINFIKKVFPSEANFLLIKVDDAVVRYQQLLKRGIVVRNRTKEPLCENTLRISVGTSEENKQLMNTLKEIAL